MGCSNTYHVMHVCGPVLGNQFHGIVYNDSSDDCSIHGNHKSHGNQNDRKSAMNLLNQVYHNIDYANIESQ